MSKLPQPMPPGTVRPQPPPGPPPLIGAPAPPPGPLVPSETLALFRDLEAALAEAGEKPGTPGIIARTIRRLIAERDEARRERDATQGRPQRDPLHALAWAPPEWCRTLVVDGALFSIGFLSDLAKSPPAAEAPWKLLRISREAGSDDVHVTVSRSLFLVGRNTDPLPWEVMGLYTSKEVAVAKCREWVDFVMELRLDEDLPEAREIPPSDRCWYPLAEGTA